MTCMTEIARRFLNRSQRAAAYWEAIPEAVALFQIIHSESIWAADYNSRIQAVRSKKIEDLSLDEIRAYLTAAAAKERSWGAYSRCVADGTIDRLLTRYLELTDGSDPNAPRA